MSNETAKTGNLPEIVKNLRAGSVNISLKFWKANGDKPASHFLEIGQKGKDDKWSNIQIQISDAASIGEALTRLKQLAILREDGAAS
jgi:hypothetical protein